MSASKAAETMLRTVPSPHSKGHVGSTNLLLTVNVSGFAPRIRILRLRSEDYSSGREVLFSGGEQGTGSGEQGAGSARVGNMPDNSESATSD